MDIHFKRRYQFAHEGHQKHPISKMLLVSPLGFEPRRP